MKNVILLIIFLPTLLVSQGSLLLMGGGSDTGLAADSAFIWMVQQADSGIIINIDSDPVAESYATTFIERGADPATHSLRITASQANDQSVYDDLITASGIWIEGGDQEEYIDAWKGSLVEDALKLIFQNGGVIGGTSAGAMVLGSVDFSAQYGSLYADDVTYDPYEYHMTFEADFLNLLPNALVDTHFNRRGRIGRLVPMIARRITDNNETDIMGIGIDEQTTLCIDGNGMAKVQGEGTVVLIYKDENSEIDCRDNVALTFTNVVYHQLTRGTVFDMNSRVLVDPGEYLDPVTEYVENDDFSETTLNGRIVSDEEKGSYHIESYTGNISDSWYGTLSEVEGSGLVPNTGIVTHFWDDYDFFQNRYVGGVSLSVGRPGYKTIFLDGRTNSPSIYGQAEISDGGILSVTHGAVYILETYGATHSCDLYRRLTGSKRTDYRGIVNARLHFLKEGNVYDLSAHGPVSVTDPDKIEGLKFVLIQNYPNPFNPKTVISYRLSGNREVELNIYNALGQKIETIFSGMKTVGQHQIEWDASNYASGVYYYQLKNGSQLQTKKMLLLK